MISLKESQELDELAGVLYDLLPGSGNPRLSFPTVAAELGLQEYWSGGSKRPAIVTLLTATYERERHRFCPLVEGVVRKAISWRAGKRAPLTREEVDRINSIVLNLGFQIPSLHDPNFLVSLERRNSETVGSLTPKDAAALTTLGKDLVKLSSLDPQPRGFAFEKLLNALFDSFDLAPRGSFRLVGEQIDGSFSLEGQTYLLEAKWRNEPVGRTELSDLHDKVTSKARWSRGLFVSYSGFSADGLAAFERGRPTGIIACDGLDLYEILSRRLPLPNVLLAKARRAAETNRCYVPVRDLY